MVYWLWNQVNRDYFCTEEILAFEDQEESIKVKSSHTLHFSFDFLDKPITSVVADTDRSIRSQKEASDWLSVNSWLSAPVWSSVESLFSAQCSGFSALITLVRSHKPFWTFGCLLFKLNLLARRQHEYMSMCSLWRDLCTFRTLWVRRFIAAWLFLARIRIKINRDFLSTGMTYSKEKSPYSCSFGTSSGLGF